MARAQYSQGQVIYLLSPAEVRQFAMDALRAKFQGSAPQFLLHGAGAEN